MDNDTAIRLVNSFRFRPGWRFTAERSSWPHLIYVDAVVDTYDTSYRTEDGTLYKRETLAPGMLIDPGGLDEAGLAHAILTRLVWNMDKHEDREFLTRRHADGRWIAPLHPHTADGQDAWRKLAA